MEPLTIQQHLQNSQTAIVGAIDQYHQRTYHEGQCKLYKSITRYTKYYVHSDEYPPVSSVIGWFEQRPD